MPSSLLFFEDEASSTFNTSDRASSDAVEVLYRTEAPRLRRYIRRRTGDHEVASELVQEAFTRLCAACRQGTIRSTEAYLRRVVRNLLIDKLGRKQSHVTEVPLDAAGVLASAPDQMVALEASQLAAKLREALDLLTPRTREVFQMHREEGLRYAEIAQALGITISTVEYHIGRALVQLDKVIGGQ